jgi:hypothetical protein
MTLTAASQELFVAFANDSANWGGMVPTDSFGGLTKAQTGNLTDLKVKSLIETQDYDGATWVTFTEAGAAYAASLGIEV